MLRSARARAAVYLFAALVLVGGVIGVSTVSTRELVLDAEDLNRTHDAIARLETLLALIADVEAGSRSYAVTGARDALIPYEDALKRLPEEAALLRAQLEDQPAQVALLDRLVTMARTRIALARNIVQVRDSTDGAAVRSLVQGDRFPGTSLRDIRETAAAMIHQQKDVLAARDATMRATARRALLVAPLAGGLSLALAGISFTVLLREIGVRRRAVALNQRRLHDIEALANMSHYLQACKTVEEAHAYAVHVLEELFPGSSGSVSVAAPAPDTLETVGRWGAPGVLRAFSFDDCWGLRRSSEHAWPGDGTAPSCAHVTGELPAAYVCLPLQVQSKAFGVIHIAAPDPATLDPARRAVAAGAAEQVSLALANLQLRDRLRRESLRDPLTGVHNRRFLDEALPRELALAQRRGRTLSVALIDADHFKNFNDRHGHEAGDQVLRALGELLRDRFRGTDLVCRYGGEEFVIVLPDAALDDALECAEDVRRAAKAMTIVVSGRELPPVTLSIGVASFPEHGNSPARLLRAADMALYAAKSAGRDRVLAADCPTGVL